MIFFRLISGLIGILVYLFSGLHLLGFIPVSLPVSLIFSLYISGAFLLSLGLTPRVDFKFLPRNPSFWHFFCLSIFIPFYGGIGALVTGLFRTWRHEESDSMREIKKTYSFIHFDENILLKEFIRFGSAQKMLHHELWAQSYFDIMRGNNRALKKVLISKILKEWTPNGISLLQSALRDPDYDIRSYAASTLNALEDQMNKNLLEIKKKLKQKPDQLPLKLALARGYFFFINTGIIDPVLEKHYIELILNILKSTDESLIDSPDLRLDYLMLKGDIARVLKKHGEEKQVYQKILNIQPKHTTALARLCTMSFQERDFSMLKKTCDNFVRYSPANNPFIEPARFFTTSRDSQATEATA